MKKIHYFFLLLTALVYQPMLTSAQVTVIPTSDELIFPRYMCNGGKAAQRLPYACMLKLTGLTANATYNYFTGATTNNNYTSATPPGNFFSINNVAGGNGNITGYTSQKGMAGSYLGSDSFITSTSKYSSFTTDANGEYSGYFSVVPTANAAFAAGNDVYFYIYLNDGAGGITTDQKIRTSSTIKMLSYGKSNVSGSTDCSAIRGNSLAKGETFVFLYDDTTAKARPVYGTWAENDGITTNFTSWYNPTVDTTTGAWGAIIPNDNALGIRRIESRDWKGNVLYNHHDADGTWGSGVITANPTNDTIPLVITVNDAPLGSTSSTNPEVSFAVTSQSQLENVTTYNVDINITNPNASQTSVDVAVAGGTASGSGADYTYTTQTVNFPANSTTKQSISITIVNDNVKESDETIILKLQNTTNGATIKTGADMDTLTILNDDSASSGSSPEVSFAVTSQSQLENAGNISVDVNITNPNATQTSVDIVVLGGTATGSGTDYTYATQTVTFPANSSTKQTITVTIANDNIKEGDETIILKLQNATNSATIKTGADMDTLTILNDDSASSGSSPEVSFAVTSQSQLENAGNISVDVNITNPNSTQTSVDIVVLGGTAAGSGTDYSYTTQTVTFPANSSTKQTITVSITNDNIKEGDETIILQLQNATNSATIKTGAGVDTLTILNDDTTIAPYKPTVTFELGNSNVNEGSNASINVFIDSFTTADITVDAEVTGGTGVNGVNFNFTKQTITFPTGNKSPKSVSIPTLSDKKAGNKTIILTLKNISTNAYLGATTIHTITILDDGKLGVGSPFESNIKVYPNPVNDILYISTDVKMDYIILTDLNGKTIYQENNIGNQIGLSTSGLSKGVYLLQIASGNNIYNQKILVN